MFSKTCLIMYKRYVKQLSRRFCNFFTGQKRPSVAKHSNGAGENILCERKFSEFKAGPKIILFMDKDEFYGSRRYQLMLEWIIVILFLVALFSSSTLVSLYLNRPR
jgi:hypothetical protein